ncbi:unnamed protein product [Closterium sp. NIES-54]
MRRSATPFCCGEAGRDKKVLTKPLTELETDCTDPRDQDNRDLTLAAQGEDRGVTRAVANNQQSDAARGAESGGGEPAGAEPRGAEPTSAEPGGAEPEGAEPGGAETEGADPGGAESEGAESGGAELWGTASARGPAAGGAGATIPGGAGVTAGAEGTGGAGAAGPGGARTRGYGAAGAGGAGVGGTRAGHPGVRGTGAGDPGARGARARGAGGAGTGDPGAGGTAAQGTGAGGPGAGRAGARGTGAGVLGAGGGRAGDPRAEGAGAGGTGVGGTVQRRPFFVLPPPGSVLHQVLSLPSSTGLTPSLLCPPPHQTQPPLQPNSPLPAPSPYAEQTDSLTERRDPESHPTSPVCAVRTGRCVPRPRPPPVLGTHIIRPSFVPLRAPLPSPPASSLADGSDPEFDLVCAASPTVPRLLALVVTDPLFESADASALVAELVDFAAAYRLDYAASLVVESETYCPPAVGGECALGTDVLEDKQEDFECLADAIPHLEAMLLAPQGDPDAPDIPTPRSYAEAITGPYSSQWQTAMDAQMASWKSTGTYVDAVPPPGANIVDGMWIFRVKRPPSSPPAFKACYVARGFSQRQGVDFFQIFSPTPKITTLLVLLHVAAHRDYELHSLDFSTSF